MKTRAMAFVALSLLTLNLASCDNGNSSSSSSSNSGPSGLSSDQKDRYNNMSPEGKKYVDDQMRAYDKGK